MAKKKYVVRLSEEERAELLRLVKQGKVKVRTINRTHTFSLSDEGKTDEQIAAVLRISSPASPDLRRAGVGEIVTVQIGCGDHLELGGAAARVGGWELT